MGSVIASLEKETGKTCFDSFRRSLDHERMSILSYDDSATQFMEAQGETERLSKPRDVSGRARDWQENEPAFTYFLDGSRRTYKIADIPIGTQVFPVIAGQVGVGVCKRENRTLSPCNLMLHSVMALPDKLDSDGKGEKQHRVFFANLASKLNQAQRQFQLDSVLWYETNADAKDDFEDKGVAHIQDFMIEKEKAMVQWLVDENLLNDRNWLIKDGSLEYSNVAADNPFAFSKIRSNYKRVVGVSKSFNPELAKLTNNRSAARMIADLAPFHRTPVSMYSTERVGGKFAIWYVRLRESRWSRSPFGGVVKVEKILTTSREEEYGLDTAEVDNISAWLVNERNPVCYGKDERWANHLYPVYLTEAFIKKYGIRNQSFSGVTNGNE